MEGRMAVKIHKPLRVLALPLRYHRAAEPHSHGGLRLFWVPLPSYPSAVEEKSGSLSFALARLAGLLFTNAARCRAGPG